MKQFHKKSKSKLYGVLGHEIGENLRQQALSKNFNTAPLRKRKSKFKIYETVKVLM